MLAGRARAEVGGQTRELGPGDSCYFPADTFHTFTKVSEEPVRVLVIYTPPYGESKDKAVTPG
jgi:mannose-6-phosphate isomerase-like protein (cupin superfamily)